MSKPAFVHEAGVPSIPVARVQKIIKADKEVQACSKEATFLIGVATEFFIKKLTDEAYLKARMDNRKTIGVKDVASSVKQVPEFGFLEEIVPIALPLPQALAAKVQKEYTDSLPPSLADDLVPIEAYVPVSGVKKNKNRNRAAGGKSVPRSMRGKSGAKMRDAGSDEEEEEEEEEEEGKAMEVDEELLSIS